jgi:release factor glutamine methyltransferase
VRREPLAYILGQRAFYGLELGVDRRVLVPRPETEGLVERTVAFAGRRAGEGLTIADIGTGSGCIAIALAVALPRARIIAVDAAPGALAVARQNARRHGAARRIAFRRGDLLAPLRGAVDIIVSNPPYVACGEIAALAPEIAGFEPRQALDGGADGLDVIRRLVADAPRWLTPGGALFVEIGDRQGALAADLARRAFAASAISVERDLAGKVRYLCVLT